MDHPLLADISQALKFTPEEEAAFKALEVFKRFEKGTLILQAGDVGKNDYFVVQGCIRSYYLHNDEEYTLEFYTEGHSIATATLPKRCYLSCEEDTLVSITTPEIEQQILAKFPRFYSVCQVMMTHMLAHSQEILSEIKSATPEERYANLVATRPSLLERVPQYQIASYIGVKPESLSRIRRRLAQKNAS